MATIQARIPTPNPIRTATCRDVADSGSFKKNSTVNVMPDARIGDHGAAGPEVSGSPPWTELPALTMRIASASTPAAANNPPPRSRRMASSDSAK
jgi:hypothetical protein